MPIAALTPFIFALPTITASDIFDFSFASFIRWHPSGNWIFAVVNGNIVAIYAREDENFGKTVWLTNDKKDRTELVFSNNGNVLAYNMMVPDETGSRLYKQIFILEPEWERLHSVLK